MTTLLELTTESVRFATDRLQQNLETQRAMLACRKPADVLRLQADFYRKAVEQYTTESTRLFEMMSKSAVQSMSHAKSVYARGYDDVPL